MPLVGNTQSILPLICTVSSPPRPAHLSILQIPEPRNPALFGKEFADVTSQLLDEEIILVGFKCHQCPIITRWRETGHRREGALAMWVEAET